MMYEKMKLNEDSVCEIIKVLGGFINNCDSFMNILEYDSFEQGYSK